MGTNAYQVGPPLPAELPKSPFRPAVAGRIGFFLGPMAGAFVSAISLRRMGFPDKAQKVISIACLGATLLIGVVFFLPDAFSHIVGLAAEIGFYLVFPKIQDAEFAAWQAANTTVKPANGWKAIPWGFAGAALLLPVAVIIIYLLALFGIEPR